MILYYFKLAKIIMFKVALQKRKLWISRVNLTRLLLCFPSLIFFKYAQKNIRLILGRMFHRCKLNCFTLEIWCFWYFKNNCSKQYVLSHMHNNFLNKFNNWLNYLWMNSISYKIKEVYSSKRKFLTLTTLQYNQLR